MAPRSPRKPPRPRVQAPPGNGALTQGVEDFGKRLRAANSRGTAKPMERVGKVASTADITQHFPSAQELLELTAPKPSQGWVSAAELLGDWETIPTDFADADDEAIYAPTASTRPERPRTLEMSYSRQLGRLRVVFRHGGTYEYYQVPPAFWAQIKRVKSPGKFLDRRIIGVYGYQKVSA